MSGSAACAIDFVARVKSLLPKAKNVSGDWEGPEGYYTFNSAPPLANDSSVYNAQMAENDFRLNLRHVEENKIDRVRTCADNVLRFIDDYNEHEIKLSCNDKGICDKIEYKFNAYRGKFTHGVETSMTTTLIN